MKQTRRSFCLYLPCVAAIPTLYAEQHKAPHSEALDLHSMMQPIPDTAMFAQAGYEVWGGTVVKGDDDKYHMFYSRWPARYGGNSWVNKSEIAHAVSDSPFGIFTFHDVTLPRRGKEYWDGLVTHNPTVQRFGDKYYLYYMGNTGDDIVTPGLNMVHRNNQRIGVAVADSPYGPWKRFDDPVIDASSNTSAPDSLCVANPTVARSADGIYHLLYKAVGRQKPLPFGGPVVHLVASSASPIGPFKKNLQPQFLMPGETFPFEDPFMWFDVRRARFFCIMKDNSGEASGTHHHSLVLFESADTTEWKRSRPFLVSDLTLHWADQPVQSVSNLERPQMTFDENGEPLMLVVAISAPGAKATFNVRIPLKA
jgi:hypothetical protein